VLAIDHPRPRYFIGDVRDLGRLERALADATMAHAATLKQAQGIKKSTPLR
jgi:FlaA1/EpsC-like NDP-sugar epimerase